MPFVRISLRRGKPKAYLLALSDSIHRAMTEAFDVPGNDCFQAIHLHDDHELVFDRHYMGGPRSDDWVLVHIVAGRPRAQELKRRFYRRLADVLAVSPGIAAEDVMVIIQTTQSEDWSFGGGVAAIDASPVSNGQGR